MSGLSVLVTRGGSDALLHQGVIPRGNECCTKERTASIGLYPLPPLPSHSTPSLSPPPGLNSPPTAKCMTTSTTRVHLTPSVSLLSLYASVALSLHIYHYISFCPSVCLSVCVYPSLSPISLPSSSAPPPGPRPNYPASHQNSSKNASSLRTSVTVNPFKTGGGTMSPPPPLRPATPLPLPSSPHPPESISAPLAGGLVGLFPPLSPSPRDPLPPVAVALSATVWCENPRGWGWFGSGEARCSQVAA